MLLTRIVTAIVLLAVLLPAIFFAPPWAWGLISLVFLIQGAREWGRLLGLGRQTLVLTAGLALFGLLWLTLSNVETTRWAALSLCGVALSAWFLFMPGVLRAVGPAGPGLALAALSLSACWVALFELRKVSPALLLSAMALVWVADIGAYAGGRLFGRHKLAPRVSPGKTWEGAMSGLLAVCGLALGAQALLPVEWIVWSSLLMNGFGLPLALLLIAATVALSITGDLFESALKRAAGVKDSSHVLPGHGGVLDRIDALIPTMPAALLLYMLLP
jgi:phosphatidate cytidylyltransferase